MDWFAPTQQQYKASPGFKFALDTGLDAVKRHMAASGMLHSGNTLGELTDRATGMALQDYNNFANRDLQRYQGDQQFGLGMYRAGNDYSLGRESNANNAMSSYFNYDLGKERNGIDAANSENRYNLDSEGNDINWWNADTNRGNAAGNMYLNWQKLLQGPR